MSIYVARYAKKICEILQMSKTNSLMVELPHNSPNKTLIYNRSGRTIVRDHQYAIKAGKDVTKAEASALQLAYFSGIPVPAVHSLQNTMETVSITMDFIEGETLEDCWPRLSQDQKLDIALQMKNVLDNIQKCVSPNGTISNCDNGPIQNLRHIQVYSGGPFQNEEAFNNHILDFHNGTPLKIQQGFRKRLNSRTHKICLTHTDLSPRNIMVRANKIVAILDWEYAGWYPEYWEYVSFFDRSSKAKDWWDYAEHIFSKTFEEELLDFQGIARWQKR